MKIEIEAEGSPYNLRDFKNLLREYCKNKRKALNLEIHFSVNRDEREDKKNEL